MALSHPLTPVGGNCQKKRDDKYWQGCGAKKSSTALFGENESIVIMEKLHEGS